MDHPVQSITFSHPSKEKAGGAEFLFVRMADYIAEHFPIRVNYVEFVDGFAHQHIQSDKVHFLDVIPGQKVKLDPETHLVMPLSALREFRQYLDVPGDTRIFFWSLHSHAVIWALPYFEDYVRLKPQNIRKVARAMFPEDYRLLQELMRLLFDRHALAFMEYYNFHFNNTIFHLRLPEKRYLPIPIDVADVPPVFSSRRVKPDAVHAGWLGRLSVDKIYTILGLIDDLATYAEETGEPVTLHMIGHGTEEQKIKDFAKDKAITLKFPGTLLGSALDTYMTRHMDVLFAHGTAALEGAKRGLPVAMLPGGKGYNKGIGKGDKLIWLYESFDYCLGYDARLIQGPANYSVGEILAQIYQSSEARADIGRKCYDYLMANHTLAGTVDRLLSYLAQNTCSLKTLLTAKALEQPDRPVSFRYMGQGGIGGGLDAHGMYQIDRLHKKMERVLVLQQKMREPLHIKAYKEWGRFRRRLRNAWSSLSADTTLSEQTSPLPTVGKSSERRETPVLANVGGNRSND